MTRFIVNIGAEEHFSYNRSSKGGEKMGMPDNVIWSTVATIIDRSLKRKGHQAIIEVTPHLPHQKVRIMTVMSADRTEHPGSFILVVTHRKNGKVTAKASDQGGCFRHFGKEIADRIEGALNRREEAHVPRRPK